MRGGLFYLPPSTFFFFFPPGVLLISPWGCSWRLRSVGNDAWSFNYRSRRTSVRKADREKDWIRGEEARSFPLPTFFPIWTGGARKPKREPNIARLGREAGNLPPLCNQLFLETFSPFLLIVARPVRKQESEEGRRERTITRGNSCTVRPGAPRSNTRAPSHTRTLTRTVSPSSGPRPWTRDSGLGRPLLEPVHRALDAPVPLAPPRAPGCRISSACPKGDMPFGHVTVSTGSETSKK